MNKLLNEITQIEREELMKNGCIICKTCFNALTNQDFINRDILGFDDSGHYDYIDYYKCDNCGITDNIEDLNKYNDDVYFIKNNNVYYYNNQKNKILKYNKNTLLGNILHLHIQLYRLLK